MAETTWDETKESITAMTDITSPSQLQEATLDQDVSSFGCKIVHTLHNLIRSNSYKQYEYIPPRSVIKMDAACIKAILRSRMSVAENDQKSNISLHTETEGSDDDDRDSTSIYSLGIKSPTAMRGRSVKEFEEQLTNLRKENFNLKLRIYFLEERMGPNYNLDKESAVKKNVELMVEIESLRKDLQEKQDLLCQALKAMELEEEEHKKETQDKDDLLQKYQQQIDELEQRLQDNDIFHMEDYNSDGMIELQNRIKILEEELMREKQNTATLEDYIKKNSNACSKSAKELEELLKQKEQDINHLYNEIHEVTKKFSNCSQRARNLEVELERCSLELQEKGSELMSRQAEIDNMSRNMEILRGSLADTQELYKKEAARAEKFKTAVMMCNNKMVEFEKTTEAQKLKIRSLEQKLENVQAEVNNKSDEAINTKSPMRRKLATKNTDVDSFSVPDATSVSKKSTEKLANAKTSSSPKLEAGEHFSPNTITDELKKCKDELTVQQEKNLKLKSEQFKACQIIKQMVSQRAEERKTLRERIETLESELKAFKARDAYEMHKTMPLLQQHTAGTASTMAPSLDNEKSMADGMEETKMLAEQYKTLSSELEKQIKILMQTLQEKDNQMDTLKQQLSNLLDEIKEKEHRITDLEFELLTMNNSDVSKSHVSLNSEKKDTDNEKDSSFWVQQIEEKDKEIERLEGELRKRTCDLQGIVNKELWQKNREIEKLQNRLETKDVEIVRLEGSLSSKEEQLKVLKEKICELGDDGGANTPDDVKTLQDRLIACQQERKYFMEQIDSLKTKLEGIEDSDLVELQAENKHLQDELEKSERLRVETNEICACLSKRLEELALFLESLLQQKSVLGFLGWKQNGLIKRFVSQSLELSKTLSVTISQNPNQSLMEISNISTLLTATESLSVSVVELLQQKDDNAASFALIPSDATLTYQSHLQKSHVEMKQDSVVEEQNQIIKVLREQIENLKREIEMRDIELNKFVEHQMAPAKSKVVEKIKTDNNSESESWSEPDRSVSLARIGLIEESLSLKRSPTTTATNKRNRFLTSASTESTEEELSRTLTRTPSRKSLLAENRQTIITLHNEVCELERRLKETEVELQLERSASAEKQRHLEELQGKVRKLEENFAAAENRKREAESLLREAEKSLEVLQVEKSELQAQLIYKDKVMLNRINELEIERNKAMETVQAAEKMAEDAKAHAQNVEQKLQDVQNEIEGMKNAVRQECEEQKRIECEAIKKQMENIEVRAKAEVEQTQIALKQLQTILNTDYVKKIELEIQTKHLQDVLKELDATKSTLCATEMTLKEMRCQEVQLKQKFRDIESQQWAKINELHKELDTINLQYSETVLEKTKLSNEKTLIEQKLKAIDTKETEVIFQAADFQKQIDEMKDAFQKQVAIMENKKTKLEIRVSELESINAELKNKLIVLQTSINEQFLSGSTTSNRLYEQMYAHAQQQQPSVASATAHQQLYRRQFSDNSGYTSEEQAIDDGNRQVFVVQAIGGDDVDRLNANSSPDLGIESDHGRFSSLEASIPRPLLQTLELTESMSNLLDGDSSVQISDCNNEQCCKKTQQIVTENSDLKRRLLRTRRALEETVTQLTIANQRKKQVEKTICKQIHKTSQVLRKAKANLDSGSETDVTARK